VNIVLFGPPGAGKGTQTNYLIKNFNLFKVSSGDILRNEILNKSPLSKQIKSTIDEGSFVSDELINSLIENIISNKKYINNFIFDGYPRNFKQAKNLDLLLNKYDQTISCVLCLSVSNEIITKRILGREICSKCGQIFNKYFMPSSGNNHSCGFKYLEKRADDNEATITKRLKTYEEETSAIIEYYKNQNLLHVVDASGEIDAIYKEILRIINILEG
tara:strand:- start:406 stop:1056 length:651 start_codon:yes stop_codon:yes gene_type:complete